MKLFYPALLAALLFSAVSAQDHPSAAAPVRRHAVIQPPPVVQDSAAVQSSAEVQERAVVQEPESEPLEPPPPPPPPVQSPQRAEAAPAAPSVPQAAPDAARPNIAVYVTGEVSGNEKKALGTYILDALVNSGRFNGIERTASFLAEIDREQVTQRSGAIDDRQISKVGIQFGVKFVCIADITPALGAFQVSARIVNVETAEVAFIGQATGPLKTIDDLTDVSAKVVRKMFGIPEPSGADSLFRRPRVEISIGAGASLTWGYGGGVKWPSGERVTMPYSATGGNLFFDAVYAELFFGYAAGDGQWGSNSAPDKSDLPYMPRAYIDIGVFGKYPFRYGRISFFPLVGGGYEAAISGKIKYADHDDEVPFDGSDDKPEASSLSASWFKFGAGIDFAMGKSVYLRAEAVYGLRGSNKFEHFGVDHKPADVSDGLSAASGSSFAIKIGVGAKF